MFNITVSKNQIKIVRKEPITSGSVNAYLVKFDFSEEWSDLERVAVFKSTGSPIEVLLDSKNECFIPWEVMTTFGTYIYFGVYGKHSSEVVLPTIWARTDVVLEGVVTSGQTSNPPTPGMLDQVIHRLTMLEDSVAVSLTNAKVSKNSIMLWHGPLDTIPEGWVLCDGQNGTPDLRYKFVLGAGDPNGADEPEYTLGETGGEKEHTLTVDEMPTHRHDLKYSNGILQGGTSNLGIRATGNQTTVNFMNDVGGSQPHNNMPPYYVMYYIMCIKETSTDLVPSWLTPGFGLMVSPGNVLDVNIANDLKGDNSRPVSAAVVESSIGNIEALLQTI